MKKFLLISAAAAAFGAAPVFAADMPMKAPISKIAARPFNWTGCYIGASAGGIWGKVEPQRPDTPNVDPRGFIGGAQAGCDYQAPSNWLIGVQAGFGWSGANDRATENTALTTDMIDAKIDWAASATARLGYASGPWLLYAKGGAAWMREKLSDSGAAFLVTAFDFSGNVTRSGWTAGAGVEYAFAPNWSASIECDYYDFGTKSVAVSGLTGAPVPFIPSTESFPLKQSFSAVKVGINYRFATGQ